MVMVVVAVTAGHPPEAGIVYVIVYGPGVLELGVIKPDVALIESPAPAL